MKTRRPVGFTVMSAVTAVHPGAITLTAASPVEQRMARLAVTRAAPHTASHVVVRVMPARMLAALRKATGEPRTMTPAPWTRRPRDETTAAPMAATPRVRRVTPRAHTTLAARTVRPKHPGRQPPPARTMAVCACPS